MNPKYAEHQTKEQASMERQTAREKFCFTKKAGPTGNDTGNKDGWTKSKVRLNKDGN